MQEPSRTREGDFARPESRFRERITADGSSGYPAEPGRYHLYVSYACPWAHRTLIVRALKGLEDAIGVTVTNPILGDYSWAFDDGPGHTRDPINGFSYLMDAYKATDPGYTGRATTPTLWDTRTRRVVSNESSEIIRMLGRELDAFAKHPELDLYPPDLREAIDALNARIYSAVNNGVYRCGFASTQQAYERAFDALFAALDELEERLATRRYLTGDRLTEADWRLWVTLVRFDAVYYVHFKTNLRRIADYPNLWGYTRELFQVPGVAATVNMDHIKRHYYGSHRLLNPSGIVPKGPAIDFLGPHGRDRITGSR
jgi:putative glutathione S-transferase